MPLQIRRGTDAERQALIPSNGLVVGELLYVTDSQQVYIGTGNSGEHQGLAVTGYTNENAVDAAAAALVAGSHTNISFTYGSTQDTVGRIDATVNLSNYVGTITADAFRGSVYGDDSSLLIDGTTGRVVCPVFANVTGNLTGNVTGILTGNVTGNLTGNVTGYHNGDMSGSVFADDSSIIVDAVSNTVRATSITLGGNIQINGESIVNNSGSNIVRFDQTGIDILTDLSGISPGISSTGVTNGPQSSSLFSFYGSRGTTELPTTVNTGDSVSAMFFLAHNGTDYVGSSALFAVADGVPNSSNDSVPGKLVFATANGVDDIFSFSNQMTFDSNGVLVAPVMQTGSYADNTARDAAITIPAAGMIILNGSTFQGYNGSSWVTLG